MAKTKSLQFFKAKGTFCQHVLGQQRAQTLSVEEMCSGSTPLLAQFVAVLCL